jgi:hypothetical protein
MSCLHMSVHTHNGGAIVYDEGSHFDAREKEKAAQVVISRVNCLGSNCARHSDYGDYGDYGGHDMHDLPYLSVPPWVVMCYWTANGHLGTQRTGQPSSAAQPPLSVIHICKL